MIEAKIPKFTLSFTCFGPDGLIKWRETKNNLVTTDGLNDLVSKYFKGSGYSASWYLGLKGSGSAAAGDTLSSHSGWSEVSSYTGNRPQLTFGSVSSGACSASDITYSINGDVTIAGGFVCSVASGTSGVLYSVAAFNGSVVHSCHAGDSLLVSSSVSFTSA